MVKLPLKSKVAIKTSLKKIKTLTTETSKGSRKVIPEGMSDVQKDSEKIDQQACVSIQIYINFIKYV